MRILHIDETFHPNFGYQCNPLAKFQSKAGNEVFIITPEKKYIYGVYEAFGEHGDTIEQDDKNYETLTGVKVIRVHAKGRIAGRLNYNMKELITAIDEVKPDAIMVHCVETLTAIRLMRILRKRYPMVFDSHMLSMASKNKFVKLYEFAYRMLCTSIIKKERYMVIKTQDDDYVTSHLGIPEEQTKFISFGTDTMLFCPNEAVRKTFIEEHGLPENTFVISSTGKMSKSKGGMLFAEAVEKKFNTNRPVAISVVANFPGEYEQAVKEKLEKSENHVFFYPVQKYLELAKFYQIADVVIFPKQCSMSFYDAQSCGCPVISEKGHVNEERNSHGNGLNFECGSVSDFRSKMEEMMNMPEEEYKKMRSNSFDFVSQNYSYGLIASLYTEELQNAYDAFWKKKKGNR